ncbi:MAG: hypothetical protein LBU60_03615 [Clostridiales bacterium]|jgi:hypothetical protein|nr:hypothetical protein [Clostridiales bacterium]
MICKKEVLKVNREGLVAAVWGLSNPTLKDLEKFFVFESNERQRQLIWDAVAVVRQNQYFDIVYSCHGRNNADNTLEQIADILILNQLK